MKTSVLNELNTKEHMYVLYSRATRHPFVIYNGKTESDRIFVFTELSDAERKRDELSKFGYILAIGDVNLAFRMKFFVDAHAWGVTEVIAKTASGEMVLLLNEIQPLNLEKLPLNQRPHMNPELQLTSIHFLQEHSREVLEEQLTEDDRQIRMELDNAFAQNLAKAKFMVPIHMKKGNPNRGGTRLSKDSFDYVYTQDEAGRTWLPLFSDVTEFELFNRDNKMQAILLELPQVRAMIGEQMAGAILNPACQAYRILPAAMDAMISAF